MSAGAHLRAELRVGPLTFRWREDLLSWYDEPSGLAFSAEGIQDALGFPDPQRPVIRDPWKPNWFDWNPKPEPITIESLNRMMRICEGHAEKNARQYVGYATINYPGGDPYWVIDRGSALEGL